MADVSTLVGGPVGLKTEDRIVDPEVEPPHPTLDAGRRRFITAMSTGMALVGVPFP